MDQVSDIQQCIFTAFFQQRSTNETLVGIVEEHGAVSFVCRRLGVHGPEVRIEPPDESTPCWRMMLTRLSPQSITNMSRDVCVYPINADNAQRLVSAYMSQRAPLALPSNWNCETTYSDRVLTTTDWDDGTSPLLKEWDTNGGILAVWAGASAGKSYAAIEFWKSCTARQQSNRNKNNTTMCCVDVAVRRSLVDDKMRRWTSQQKHVVVDETDESTTQVSSYRTIHDDMVTSTKTWTSMVLVTTRESFATSVACMLRSVPRPALSAPSFLFIDEFNTAFAEFTGDTMYDAAGDVSCILQQCVVATPHIMVADAYMTRYDVRTLSLMCDMRQKYTMMKTTPDAVYWMHLRRSKPARHFVFINDVTDLYTHIARETQHVLAAASFVDGDDTLLMIEPVIVATQTCQAAEELVQAMIRLGIPSDRILCYHRHTHCDLLEQTQSDSVVSMLAKSRCALFVHTCILGPGVDITQPVRAVFGLLSGFCEISPDMFLQMLLRARHPRTKTIMVCADTRGRRGQQQMLSFSSIRWHMMMDPDNSNNNKASIAQLQAMQNSQQDYSQLRQQVVRQSIFAPVMQQHLLVNCLPLRPCTEDEWHRVLSTPLPPNLELMVHLVVSRRMRASENYTQYGAIMLSLIASGGDTYAVSWLAPTRVLVETTGSVAGAERLLRRLSSALQTTPDNLQTMSTQRRRRRHSEVSDASRNNNNNDDEDDSNDEHMMQLAEMLDDTLLHASTLSSSSSSNIDTLQQHDEQDDDDDDGDEDDDRVSGERGQENSKHVLQSIESDTQLLRRVRDGMATRLECIAERHLRFVVETADARQVLFNMSKTDKLYVPLRRIVRRMQNSAFWLAKFCRLRCALLGLYTRYDEATVLAHHEGILPTSSTVSLSTLMLMSSSTSSSSSSLSQHSNMVQQTQLAEMRFDMWLLLNLCSVFAAPSASSSFPSLSSLSDMMIPMDVVLERINANAFFVQHKHEFHTRYRRWFRFPIHYKWNVHNVTSLLYTVQDEYGLSFQMHDKKRVCLLHMPSTQCLFMLVQHYARHYGCRMVSSTGTQK